MKKPEIDPSAQKDLDKAEEQFKAYDENIQSMTLDRMNAVPKQESEMQTRMSQGEMSNSKDVYLKPKRTISSREKFNETYRKDYEFQKEYVQFIAENKEIIGETISLWTKRFAGVPAEEWDVPTNKPVWGPRYLAEQIKNCTYHRFVQQDRIIGSTGAGQMYGTMAADTIIQRLDAHPVSQRKSIFISGGF